MNTAATSFTKLSREERETHFCIDEIDNCWYADSTIPKDIRRLERQGWEKIREDHYPDGTVMAARFKAPRNCLSPRKYEPNKPKRSMSEEHKIRLLASRKKNKISQTLYE